jgi:LCP family protein required for cell wall assembly
MTVPSRPRPAARAAILSFVFPGLGQAYLGERRAMLVFALPVILLVLAVLVAVAVLGERILNQLLSAAVLTGLLAANLALLAWRLAAIGHAGLWRASGRGMRKAASAVVVVVLLVATVGMHAWIGMYVGQVSSTLDDVFDGGAGQSGAPGGGGGPLNRPEYRWDGTERITFLLLGVDSGVGRQEALTDTIVVVSIDPVSGTAVMVSVPRDTGFVPLPDRSVYADGLYPKKINELSTEASEAPEAWCPDMPVDADRCGLRTLERAISLYVGIPIQYYATVDLQGFADLIDAVGGVTLCLPGPMIDPEYGGPTWPRVGIELPGGCRHYDGVHALAYSRIRKGWIEMPDGTREYQNDFLRSERQQKVLLELRREFASADLVFGLPRILSAIASTVETDFPRSLAGDLASLLPIITAPDIEQVVLAYPEFVDPPLEPLVNYLLIPRRDDVRAEMERLFGTELEGWYVGSDADGPPGAP